MKNINLSCIFLIFLSQSGISAAASFDCNKARSVSEKLICGNSELSALDDKLFDVYKKARELSNNSKEFREEQVTAWKYREQNCADNECVANWYNMRIKHYTQYINKSTGTNVQAEKNSIVSNSKESISNNTSRLSNASNPSSTLNFENSKESVLDCLQEYSVAVAKYKTYARLFSQTYSSDPQLKTYLGAIKISAWNYVSGAAYTFSLGTSKGHIQNRDQSEWDNRLIAKSKVYGDKMTIGQLDEMAQRRTNFCTNMIGKDRLEKIKSKIFIEEDPYWTDIVKALQMNL